MKTLRNKNNNNNIEWRKLWKEEQRHKQKYILRITMEKKWENENKTIPARISLAKPLPLLRKDSIINIHFFDRYCDAGPAPCTCPAFYIYRWEEGGSHQYSRVYHAITWHKQYTINGSVTNEPYWPPTLSLPRPETNIQIAVYGVTFARASRISPLRTLVARTSLARCVFVPQLDTQSFI